MLGLIPSKSGGPRESRGSTSPGTWNPTSPGTSDPGDLGRELSWWLEDDLFWSINGSIIQGDFPRTRLNMVLMDTNNVVDYGAFPAWVATRDPISRGSRDAEDPESCGPADGPDPGDAVDHVSSDDAVYLIPHGAE